MNLANEIKILQSDISRADNTNNNKTSIIKEYLNHRYVIAIFISLTLSLLIPLLSTRMVQFFSKDHKMLVLNFKFTSSPTNTMDFATGEKHMTFGKPIVLERSNIRMQVIDTTGKELYSKIYSPHGFRKNSAIQIYDEIMISGKLKVILTETDLKDGISIETPYFLMEGNEVVMLRDGKFILQN